MTVTTVGTTAANISRRAVQVLHDYTGRGPTKARTVINTDVVVILLGDTLTKGERSLVEMDMSDHVLQTRRRYQQVMQADLTTAVEEETGRTVTAFLSDNHLDPDVAAEVFVLEPLPDAPARDGDQAGNGGFGMPASSDGADGSGP